ncbi:hypothetical protein ACFYN0_35185 [Streptomyces sp. NPDC006704]|uniref:hypothetical protein n=1 Tax=Streptomyces sp. NPDC006704 TaxID=3364760 RepID=UPI00368A1831
MHIPPAAQPAPRVERVPEPVEEQSGSSWISVVQLAVVLATLTVLIVCGMSLQEAAGVIGAGLLIVGDLRKRRP